MNMTSPIEGGQAATGSVDPILLTIIARALQSAADEMALNLIRSAFSAVVREARDCSAALLDAKGRVIAQAEMLPMQTAGLSMSFAACAAQLDLSKVGPDHAILMNDPYSGGQHLNDLILFSPIFLDGELLGWAGSTAHHLDIGGGSAGVNTTAEELIQEGLVIPPILMEVGRDWHGGGIERLIFANVRTPEIGRGDMDAQFASNHVGRERVLGLAKRFGVDVLRAAMSEVLDYSERRMRAAIAAIPDGSWEGEAFMDSDGREPASPPVRVVVRLTIRGDEAEMDFSGTDRQVRAMFNAPIASSFASAVTALRTILSDRSIPANDGCNRPVKLHFPEGSLLNPHPGAPVRARGSAGLRVLDAVHMALSKVVPERCPAQGANATTGFFLCHTRPDGKMAIHLDVLGGGWGAAKGYDAIHVTDNVLSSCRLTPTESIEQIYSHVRLEEFGLWQDSAGAGTWRGGLGLFRQYRIMADDVTLSLYTDRFVVQPAGAAGGLSSPLSTLTVERDGEEISLSGHATFAMRKGDLVTVRLSGGGGWGDPLLRDRAQVAADLEDGLISPAFARDVYGYTPA
jgi:N-methylhydantoinase B